MVRNIENDLCKMSLTTERASLRGEGRGSRQEVGEGMAWAEMKEG